jgi:hypothetical protein
MADQDWLPRFWAKVNKTEGCWLWTASTVKFGYGQFGVSKTIHKNTHRLSWEIHRGPIPAGMYVCHACDVPACVNPAHLFLGTQRDNVLDCVRKGRARRTRMLGEKNHNSKAPTISPERIKEMFAGGVGVREIAPLAGVSKSTVFNIVSGKHWSTHNG